MKSFEIPRRDVLAGVSVLLRPLGNSNLSKEFLMQILLFGDKDSIDGLKNDILLLTPCFIHKLVSLIRHVKYIHQHPL